MPRGPSGERRPADSNSCAVMVAKLLTGELEEESDDYWQLPNCRATRRHPMTICSRLTWWKRPIAPILLAGLIVTALTMACTGPIGPVGLAGEPGPQGDQGETGARGEQGVPGKTGARGPDGLRGQIGPQGPQGEVGPWGEVGPTGPQGLQGELGEDGDRGPAGATGPRGATGPQGPSGPRGAMGPAGPEGDPGPSGSGTGFLNWTTPPTLSSSGVLTLEMEILTVDGPRGFLFLPIYNGQGTYLGNIRHQLFAGDTGFRASEWDIDGQVVRISVGIGSIANVSGLMLCVESETGSDLGPNNVLDHTHSTLLGCHRIQR